MTKKEKEINDKVKEIFPDLDYMMRYEITCILHNADRNVREQIKDLIDYLNKKGL